MLTKPTSTLKLHESLNPTDPQPEDSYKKTVKSYRNPKALRRKKQRAYGRKAVLVEGVPAQVDQLEPQSPSRLRGFFFG